MKAVTIALALALPALALPAAASAKKGGPQDPNREICKSKPVIGSRVERVRECHSAAQWEDMKRAESLGLMTKQFNGNGSEGERETYLPPGMQPPQ